MITTTTFAPQTRAANQAPPSSPPPAEAPAEPTPAPPQDGVSEPAGDSTAFKIFHQATRALMGGIGAVAAGGVGAAAGGIKHAADDVAPENNITKGASKILKWGGAGLGAAVGLAVGLAAMPFGPVLGLIAGPIIGAGIGGALPGMAEGVAASAKGTLGGLVHGAQVGWEKTTHLVDKLFGKGGDEPPKTEGPPQNPNGPIAQVD